MESTSLWSEAPTSLPSDKRLAPDHVCQQAQVAPQVAPFPQHRRWLAGCGRKFLKGATSLPLGSESSWGGRTFSVLPEHTCILITASRTTQQLTYAMTLAKLSVLSGPQSPFVQNGETGTISSACYRTGMRFASKVPSIAPPFLQITQTDNAFMIIGDWLDTESTPLDHPEDEAEGAPALP